jgi:hypothetical protein
MFLGAIIGLTPPLRATLFGGPSGFLHPLGDALRRVGAPVPVVGLQILTGTLGCALRQFWEAPKSSQQVGTVESEPRSEEAPEEVLDDREDAVLTPSDDREDAVLTASTSPATRHVEAADVEEGAARKARKDATLYSESQARARHGWLKTVLAGKLVLVPLVGFFTFTVMSWLQHVGAARAVASSPTLGDGITAGTAMTDISDGESVGTLAARMRFLATLLWPEDRLFRAVCVLQWSAPSCMSLIVLCHRARVEESTVQLVALLYLVMYGGAVLSTTGWVAAGLYFF